MPRKTKDRRRRMLQSDIGTVEVDNPLYSPSLPAEHRRISAIRTLRDDPVGQMHNRNQINGAQYRAARAWQMDYEIAGQGLISMQATTRESITQALRYAEPVDGSRKPFLGVTDARMVAYDRLKKWKDALGDDGHWLVVQILANKLTIKQVANIKHVVVNAATEKYVGRRFRECLSTLARAMGYETGRVRW